MSTRIETGKRPTTVIAGVLGICAATLMGVGVAVGGGWLGAAIAISFLVIALAILLTRTFILRRGYLAVEIPVLMLLVSNLTFRKRTATALANNPLDSAGIFRVALITGALLLGVIAFLSATKLAPKRRWQFGFPIWLYVAYVGVVFLGAGGSVHPLLTSYRGYELAVGLLVLTVAYRRFGIEAVHRLETLLFWFTVAHLSLVWTGVFIEPSKTVNIVASPFPFRIHGELFVVTSVDRIGEYSCLLFFWSLAKLLNGDRETGPSSRGLAWGIVAFSLVTLLASQYRTGYVAIIAGLIVLLFARRKGLLAWGALALGTAGFAFGPALARIFSGSGASSFLLRGVSVEKASNLAGRLYFWAKAIPVWKQSPIIGRGLLTASRFEVLTRPGQAFKATIHGTYVELLVGTGLIGLTLVMLAVFGSWLKAFRNALKRNGRLVPVLILTVLMVRAFTGTSFEAFQYEWVVAFTMILAMQDPRPVNEVRGEVMAPLSPYRLPAPERVAALAAVSGSSQSTDGLEGNGSRRKGAPASRRGPGREAGTGTVAGLPAHPSSGEIEQNWSRLFGTSPPSPGGEP